MSHKYKTYPGGRYFVTFTVVGWIDLFTRADYADLLLDCLAYCIHYKGLRVYEYVIMPSHVHLLVDLTADDKPLADVLRDVKAHSAKQVFRLVETHPQESRRDWLLYQLRYFGQPHGQAFKVWQEGSHPIELRDAPQVLRCQYYIHHNPVAARLVTEATAYVFSSACPDQRLPLTELL